MFNSRKIDRRRLVGGAGAVGLSTALGNRIAAPTAAQEITYSREFEGTTLNALMEDLTETNVIEEMLPEFEELTGIKVQFEKVVYPVMHDILVTQLAAGEGNGAYDFLQVDFYWTYEFARSGWVEELTPRIEASNGAVDLSRYSEALLNSNSRVDGSTYYVPQYIYPMGLIYRADLVEDPDFLASYAEIAGADFAMPTTVEEYVNVIKAVQQINPDEMYGAVMQGMQGDPIVMEFCNWLYANGGDYYNAELTEPIINNEAGVRALELFADAMNNAAQPGAANADLNDTGALWRQGRAFSSVSYLFFLSDGETVEDSQVSGKGAITTMPGGTGLTGSWSWGIPVSSPSPDAAFEFIKWVESPEIALRRGMGGGVAAQSALYENEEYIAAFPWLAQVADLAATGKGLPAITRQNQLVEIMGRHLSNAVTGGATPQEAMDAAASELADLL
ncbi:MAG: extracellular solute-binding protein [Thermomicrobiales bacterium]